MNISMQKIISIPGFTDPFSSIVHLLAALVFLVLSIILIRKGKGCHTRNFCLGLFSFACIFLLSISGTYHLLGPGPAKNILQQIDHAAIFIFIAASFTTVHGLIFKGFMRWGFLFIVWAVTITSLVLKMIFFDSIPEWLGFTFYLSLGWLGLLTFFLLCKRFGVHYNRYLFYSGIAYTFGAVAEFLKAPVLINGVLGPHEIFHVAVVIGISYHWLYTYRFADGCVTMPNGEVLFAPSDYRKSA